MINLEIFQFMKWLDVENINSEERLRDTCILLHTWKINIKKYSSFNCDYLKNLIILQEPGEFYFNTIVI